ncbi:MAG TPA: hypothetical protein VFH33_08700 [Candidatus Krumholzibacteria bacterium]|nr:hypothetical protein [Candidatus Krumholzibacteria bacterium]
MKTRLVVLTIVTLVAMSSLANADFLRPVESVEPEDCDVVLPPGATVTVYVIQKLSNGSLGCEWRVANPTEVGILSVNSSFPFTGDPFAGIKFTYSTCQTGKFVVCELTLINLGLDHCSRMAIVGLYGNGNFPTYTNCAGTTFFSGPAGDIIYNTPTSNCSPSYDSCLLPVSNESSTWGAVKSLYR